MKTALALRVLRFVYLTLAVKQMDLFLDTETLVKVSLSAEETTARTAVMAAKTCQMNFAEDTVRNSFGGTEQ